MDNSYLEPTEKSAMELFSRKISGEVLMLNMLRFKPIADYSEFPELAPKQSITGIEAFQLYIDFTKPFLKESDGEMMLLGKGGKFFIGPDDEHWDAVMLIKQNSLNSFIAFASNEEYKKGLGHRTAALEDSHLLPILECDSLTD